MLARTVLALCLELVSTTLISLSYVRQSTAPPLNYPALSLGRPLRSARLLLTSRAWLFAFAMETCGFGLYVAALALAELALVQSVAAGGVRHPGGGLRTSGAPTAHPARGNRLDARRERPRVAGISLGGGTASSAPAALGEVALWLGATVVAAVLALGNRRSVLKGGVAYGIAGGLLFAAGDIATKLATAGGARFLFVLPVIAGYLLGTGLLQIGYQRGGALTVAGIATLLTNAVPIAAGTILLNEPVPTGALGAIRILAFATVTAGAILLAQPRVAGSGSEQPR